MAKEALSVLVAGRGSTGGQDCQGPDCLGGLSQSFSFLVCKMGELAQFLTFCLQPEEFIPRNLRRFYNLGILGFQHAHIIGLYILDSNKLS